MFINKQKTKEYLLRTLEGKCTGMSDHVVMSEYRGSGSTALNEEIERISEMLGVDVGFLIKNPNELYDYFPVLSSLLATQHNNALQPHLPTHIFRLVSLLAFTHPILIKPTQQFISTYLATIPLTTKPNLETLNILSLIPTFSYSTLNLQSHDFREKSYEKALWLNAVNTLTYSEFYQEWKSKVAEVDQENVCRVRDFVNCVYQINEIVKKQVYEEYFDSVNCTKDNVIKVEDDDITYRNNLQQQREQHFSHLDIFLSFNNFITLQYLPSNFLQPSSFIQIWIDRTVQVNSLMGNFICKQKLGQFQYVKGPLLYAIEKGIVLILNNFEQISHQLLVTMRTLATRHEINHNQRTVHARSGFKIIGVCSEESRRKSKSLQNSASVVPHFHQPAKTIQNLINFNWLTNQANKLFISQTLKRLQPYGLGAQYKLWRRMTRLRKNLMNSDFTNKTQQQITQQLWKGYLTQSFKDQIQLQIQQLTNTLDPTRQIQFTRQYKSLKIGRCVLSLKNLPSQNIVPTQYSLRILERLAICQQPQIDQCPLLISETGCGKTTLVQYLAEIANKKLYVYNMSSGTDVGDLVGGFKPIDCRVMLKELFYSFVEKFTNEVPGAEKNKQYVNSLIGYYEANKLELLLKSLIQSIPKIKLQLTSNTSEELKQWDELYRKFSNILANLDKIDSNLVFSFMEGNLVTALKNGDWVLVDEINLATNDVLQKIVPLVQGKSILLYEKGDLTHVQRNPGFKIIGCMNPATDSGKKPLPPNLHSKFTSINLSQPSRPDIQLMVSTLCPQLNPEEIADIYFEIKKQKTVSLRNLSRAMAYINKNRETYGWQRAMYDGLVLGFGEKDLLAKYKNEQLPKEKQGYKMIHGFLMEQGPVKDQKVQIFHLTKTFSQHLKDFLRAIAGTDLPVLLQGPTSAGKTSMIKYVAQLAGHKCIRINNHEHTQIQQYLGNYFPDKQGKLVFREGPLVTAVRQGHWLILDELNLAKTQILQCLNRLLDDNRQLFIPQQQKHIKPHKNFRIFATQNPSSYSGRKKLSRAFRNRFISLMFGDITVVDTMAILQARRPLVGDSKQLSTYIKKVLQALLNYRQRQKVFSKDGLITMRDLLKWTGRKFVDKERFIIEGYGILAERLRTIEEKEHVFNVLANGAKITPEDIFNYYQKVVSQNLSQDKIAASKIYVQMNKSFKRMAALTYLGIESNEAILLVGETGCGKTTLAELLSYVLKRPFYSINCHKHTEASDLLGSLRPASDPNSTSKFEFVNGVVIEAMLNGGILLIDEINTAEDSVLERLNEVLQSNTIGVQRGTGWQSIKAKEGFCIIATMNPSGDYGKKQLSPALRNRFTQIWVQPITHPSLITDARSDILTMIQAKLSKAFSKQINQKIALKLYQFIQHYNTNLTERYNLCRKRLTMRDIGWVCKFLTQSKGYFTEENWLEAYFWALNILAVEGLKFMMNDQHESVLLKDMMVQLKEYVESQCGDSGERRQAKELQVIQILKQMDFPLMIKTDLPLELLGLQPDARIFFSAHTDLSDLLGQFQPLQNSFVWKDQQLLKNIRHGGRTALMDLNLAQQQVIEGVNSLFDYRGSIFVVQLNETVTKHSQFKPMVVIKYQGGAERKGLPNSFLNRFVKVCVQRVSVERKMEYFIRKYEGMSERLKELVERIVRKEESYPIQRVQLLIQTCMKSPIELKNCLSYLQLQSFEFDQFSLLQKSTQTQLHFTYQQSLLSLLPLIKQFNLTSYPQLLNIKKLHTIYQLSTFSCCLVGSCLQRDQAVQILSYLLKKKTVKIILSTMTDMNDLLGSYEQVAERGQEMREERSLDKAFEGKEQDGKEGQGKKTKFVYMQSAIVRALKDQGVLLYIQVPNQTLLQRVEKGLVEVYEQRRQIVIGIDSMRQTTSNITKFIPVLLNQHSTPPTLPPSTAIFTQNKSLLTHLDSQLRKTQLQQLLQQQISSQSQRPKILAFKKMMVENQQDCINSIESRDLLQVKEKKVKQRKIKDLPFTYDNTKDDSTFVKIGGNILGHVPNSYSKHRLYSLMKAFMSITQDQINKRVTTYSPRLTQHLTQTIIKFQTLYNCNINAFQSTALKILSVIFSPVITQQQSQQLLQKFTCQIDRLYEELFRDKITEVMIRFNEEETRVVPVLDSDVVVRYLMREKGLGVRVMSEVATRESMLVSNGIERSVLEGIQVMRVQYQEVSDWVYGMRLKDLLAYEMLQEKIKNKVTLMPQYQHLLSLAKKLLQSILPQQHYLQLSNNNPSATLLTLFKPCATLSQNVSLHIKAQLQYQTIKQVISQDQTYLQCYKQLCQIKYLSLQTNKSKLLTKQIQQYEQRLSQLAKSLVYRGHDNVKSLMEFYGYFINQHCIIEQSNYSPQTIRAFLLESHSSFYDTFADILLPYYLAVMIVYLQKSRVDHEHSLTVQMLQQAKTPGDEAEQPQSQVIQLLEEVIEADENEENDRAKDYIKYQRKFNKTVIVDQYTEEGVEKNKANVEEEFNELFGKNLTQTQHQGPMSDMDRLYYTLNKSTLTYYNILCQKLSTTPAYQHLIITTSLLTTNLPLNNIYQQRNTHCIKQLLQPLPKMLKQVNILLNKYKIDSLKQLAGLFGKIYEHKVFKDEVYKVLVDCELIVEKAFQLNAILPAVERVPTDQLIKECLKLRKLELKNWKSMLGYKQMRTQKADLINMVQFYKTLKLTQTHKEVFAVSQNFLRQSPISCLPSRLTFLDLLAKSLYHRQPLAQSSIYRVIGFYQYLTPQVNQYYLNSYNGKIQEMKEYEKLAGWSSNQYLIFKATCEKFQRKIHHILRRFDDELMMTVGALVQQVKTKEIAGSIEEFGSKVKKDLGIQVEEEQEGDKEEGDNKDHDNNDGDNKDDKQAKEQKQKSKKPKKLNKKQKKSQPQQQQPPTPSNQYQQLITQLFTCLTQLSHSYQNSQSKLRLIRVNLQQLQQLIKQKKQSLQQNDKKITSHSHQSKFLTQKMFESQEGYQKTCKYYYGLWDRLCQRHETAWNREIVERVWGVAEAIWLMVNAVIPQPEMPQKQDQLLQDIKVLFRPYLVQGNDKNGTKLNNYMDNPIFRQQLQTIKNYILQSMLHRQQQPQPTHTISPTTTSLTKLGYLLSSIALNLQKNGLCVKQSEQQNQGSGTQQVGDGMGIGQGQVHQAAQNIGDQIQFQQQLQGHKDEEKVEQQHQGKNKQEENDIQMQGDFEGEMYDKEKKQGQDNEEGQQAEQISNQQMGQVDDDKRQQDVKNQQGQAQGKSQADMDIQGQQQGQQQLVDNQRQQQKEQRKGQQKRQQGQEDEEQQQRSDWEDNNEQGDKINKQKQNVEENQREQKDMQDDKPPEEISDEQANDGEDQQENQEEQNQQMDIEEDDEDIGQSNQVSQGQQKQQIQIQNDQTPMQEQNGQQAPEQQQPQKKQAKNKKQYQRTYGRQDNKKQNNNLVHEQQQQHPQQNMGQGEENAQGQESEGQRGAGKSVHSLREEFLEEIMRKENQAKGTEEFQKNLDVRIQEENDEDVEQDGDEQQYALTQQERNKATNLGMMDLEQKHKDQQQKKKQQQTDRQRNKNKQQQQQPKPNQKQAPTPNSTKKKPSNKNSKNDQLIPKQQQVQQAKTQQKLQKQQQSLQQQQRSQPIKSQKKKPTTILIDEHEEHLIKAAVSSLTNSEKSAIPKSFAEHPHLISESFLLSKILEEQLKSVLQPLDQAQYKGDYKTGKKLNLKKIIPFIASNYRKDRIWLRRTEPSQRNYHVMLALDDTKSMHYGDVGEQALKGLLGISMALSHLNIKTCVTSIKDNMEVVKSFTDQLNCEKILQEFTFSYESSNSHDLSMSSFMSSSLKQFQKMQSSDSSAQSRQLCIIISDGKMNKQMVKPFIKQATKKGITYVFIIIDSQKNSILNIKTVEYINGKMEIKLYMTDFPFDFFLVINNAKELGDVLGATLMQFIQEK